MSTEQNWMQDPEKHRAEPGRASCDSGGINSGQSSETAPQSSDVQQNLKQDSKMDQVEMEGASCDSGGINSGQTMETTPQPSGVQQNLTDDSKMDQVEMEGASCDSGGINSGQTMETTPQPSCVQQNLTDDSKKDQAEMEGASCDSGGINSGQTMETTPQPSGVQQNLTDDSKKDQAEMEGASCDSGGINSGQTMETAPQPSGVQQNLTDDSKKDQAEMEGASCDSGGINSGQTSETAPQSSGVQHSGVQQNSIGDPEKHRAEPGSASCDSGGINSGQTTETLSPSSRLQASIEAVLDVANEVARNKYFGNWTKVCRILREHAYRLFQQLDQGHEARRELQKRFDGLSRYYDFQRRRDRSSDLRLIKGFYASFKETYDFDWIADRLVILERSTGRLQHNHSFREDENLRCLIRVSEILKKTIDALSVEGAECGDASIEETITSETASQSSRLQARIEAVLDFADECNFIETEELSKAGHAILLEHAYRLLPQLDQRHEATHELEERFFTLDIIYNFQRRRDRSSDLRLIKGFYACFKELYVIDGIEARLLILERSPEHNHREVESGRIKNWIRLSTVSEELKETIAAVKKKMRVTRWTDAYGDQVTIEDEVRIFEDGLRYPRTLFEFVQKGLKGAGYEIPNDMNAYGFITAVANNLQADGATNDFMRIQEQCFNNNLKGYTNYSSSYEKRNSMVECIGTALHWAVQLQNTKLVEAILKAKNVDVNAVNGMKSTALHMAVSKRNIDIVRQLLACKESIRPTEEDKNGQTPIEIAHTRGYKDIERVLMEHKTVSLYVEALYKNRQVYVDAANAILVGAALIASVTFASWLQPPMGYADHGYVDVEDNGGLTAFWVFNTFSFYFAIATVVFGARSVLPKQHVFIKRIVEKLRINLLVTSVLLTFSVSFVIVAFGVAGSIVLKPKLKAQWVMIGPTIIGGLVCVFSLGFLFKSILDENVGRYLNHILYKVWRYLKHILHMVRRYLHLPSLWVDDYSSRFEDPSEIYGG